MVEKIAVPVSKRFGGDDPPAVQEQIEVEGPGTPADDSLAAEAARFVAARRS